MNMGSPAPGQNVTVIVRPEEENVPLGILGAFLFSLAGGLVWVLLSRAGFIAGISGLIGIFCALKGYKFFAKKESRKGMIIAIAATVIVLLAAWYISMSWDMYDALKDVMSVTYLDCLKTAYTFLKEPEIAGAYIRDLLIGLAFCAIASVGYIMNYNKKLKAEQSGGQPPAPVFTVIRTDDQTTGESSADVPEATPEENEETPEENEVPAEAPEEDGDRTPGHTPEE